MSLARCDIDEATSTTTDEIQDQAAQFEVLDAAFHGKHLPVKFLSNVPEPSRASVQPFNGDLTATTCGIKLGDRRAFAAVQVGHAEMGPGTVTLEATTDTPSVLYFETAPMSRPTRDLREVAHFAAVEAGKTVIVADGTHIARSVVAGTDEP